MNETLVECRSRSPFLQVISTLQQSRFPDVQDEPGPLTMVGEASFECPNFGPVRPDDFSRRWVEMSG